MEIHLSLSNNLSLAERNRDYRSLTYVDGTKRTWPADLGAYGNQYHKLLLEKLKLATVSGPFFEDCYYDNGVMFTELP